MAEVLSCFDPRVSAGTMKSVEDSLVRILAGVPDAKDVIERPVGEVNGCILAVEQTSPCNIPPVTNTAMDGFAIRAADWQDDNSEFEILGKAMAGRPYKGTVGQGQCVQVMTGAPLPEGSDTVVMSEVASNRGQIMTCGGPVQKGQHVRHQGEDIRQGDVVLARGTLIRAAEQGILASMGQTQVPVFRTLTVAVFSTGDEIAAQGSDLAPGEQIYDSNRFSLMGLLTQLGCEVMDLGIAPDQPDQLAEKMQRALAQADMVISSGGVSMGEADFVKPSLQALGELDFWKVAMRPGRPLAFGHLPGHQGQIPYFGLPGNPVAVMVCFMEFVQPALRKMMGQPDWQPVRLAATAEHGMKSRQGRTDYLRGIFQMDQDRTVTVRTTGGQGSGILTSMHQANCLIELPDDQVRVNPGDAVIIQPFSDLI